EALEASCSTLSLHDALPILVGILVALGVGAAGLVRELDPLAGPAARTVATVAAVWNPFVYERLMVGQWTVLAGLALVPWGLHQVDRKSTRLNSSHVTISYAV